MGLIEGEAIDAEVIGDDSSGEIVFGPTQINPNGVIGGYSFNFSFGDAYDFEATQRTYQLLMANMPFLQNNMNHFIGEPDEDEFLNEYADAYEGSGIEVVLESEVYADVDYIPLHLAEGYGFFRYMDVDETPGSRTIVLYDALPNSLPRVGGIMTSVIETRSPMSIRPSKTTFRTRTSLTRFLWIPSQMASGTLHPLQG